MATGEQNADYIRTAGTLLDHKQWGLMKRFQNAAGIIFDPYTNQNHTVHSLRHCAICMRIIMSHGQSNVFNLAKMPAQALSRLSGSMRATYRLTESSVSVQDIGVSASLQRTDGHIHLKTVDKNASLLKSQTKLLKH